MTAFAVDEETAQASDPGRDFAALMSSAAQAAAPELDEAPFGWTTDRVTGERRPKKAAGRPRVSPSIDELKAERAETEAGGIPRDSPEPDRPPASGRRKRRAAAEDARPAPYSAGTITKGVNRLYRRAGKLVKAMDRDIGIAIIESTENTAAKGEPDDTVGAAWEEVCKSNPRIRAFMLRLLAGGAWTQLVMAHGPILLAIMLKDGIRRRLPFQRLLEAMLDNDEDQEQPAGGLAALIGDMTAADLAQMSQLAQSLLGDMANVAAR